MEYENHEEWDPALAPTYGSSRQGASHVASDTICQDAWRIHKVMDGDVSGVILAAADGHGASVHDLSHVGALAAVDAVCEILRDFLVSFDQSQSTQTLQDAFRVDIPRFVVQRWREKVAEEAETRGLEVDWEAPDPHPVFYRYGSTLLAALVTHDEVFLLSIGDGDTVTLNREGGVVVHIDQDAPGLVGSMTFSLASNDPEMLFQTKILKRQALSLLALSTDGLSKSFQNEEFFLEFSVAVQERVRADGFQMAVSSIPEILDYVSTHGSGDDMTYVIAWLEDQPMPDDLLGETHHSISLRDEEYLEMDGKGPVSSG